MTRNTLKNHFAIQASLVTERDEEAAWQAKVVRMNECLAEQHRYNTDPVYAAQSDADRARRQADVYLKMDVGRDRYWAAHEARKAAGEIRHADQ
jgi:hypothetical protein